MEESCGIFDGLIPHDDDEVPMQAFFWLTTSDRGADGVSYGSTLRIVEKASVILEKHDI